MLRARPPPLQLAIYGCLIAAIALLVSQMLGTGFTCDDDMFTATARLRWGGVWKASWTMATGHGRFYHLLVYPLAQLPYLWPGFAIPTAFRILSTATVFVAFYFAVRSLFGSAALAAFFSVIVAGLLTTTHMFNPVHALPLWFNFGMTVLLVAVLFFSEGLTSGSMARIRWSGAFFFLSSLFYETFVTYLLLFPIIALVKKAGSGQGIRQQVASALRISTPIFVAFGVWLALFLTFRKLFPPDYPGSKLVLGAPLEMLAPVLQFSRSGLNLDAAWRVDWTLDRSAVAAALAGAAGLYLSLQVLRRTLPGHSLAAIAIVGILFALMPNVIFGLTPRYREWVRYDLYYLGSFYAAFSLACVVGAGLLAVHGLARGQLAARLLAGALAGLFGVATYANHLESSRFFGIHRANREQWTLLDEAVAHGLLRDLGPRAVLVAPQLMRMPLLSPYAYDYWSYYLTGALGRPLQVVETPRDQSQLPPATRQTLPSLDSNPELWGLALHFSSATHAGIVGIARIDASAWRSNEAVLPTRSAHVYIEPESARPGRLIAHARQDQVLSLPLAAGMDVRSLSTFDLKTLSFTDE